MMTKERTLPVTLLSGFLGAGKTTLLKYILETQNKYKIACIVNDMAELNIDASLVSKHITQREVELVQMQNGCICCTLRMDLIDELTKLSKNESFDYVVIESTGISEPMQVAESFFFEQMPKNIKLDTCVTVVDSLNFRRDMLKGESTLERFKEECNTEDAIPVSSLLIDQVEFADVILLNKCDLVTEKIITEVENMIRKLNRRAKIYRTIRSQVPIDSIINTNLFDEEQATQSAGWLQSLQQGHIPETEEYGVSSFIYTQRKPFDPIKLFKLCFQEGGYLSEPHKQFICRSKGFVWIFGPGDINDVCFEWSQAGAQIEVAGNGFWMSLLDKEEWEQLDDETKKRIEEDFQGEHKDRRQEIVFIGFQKMDQKRIQQELDACLIDDKNFEKGPKYWVNMCSEEEFPDVFEIKVADDDDDMEEDSEDDGEEDEAEEIERKTKRPRIE